MAKGHIYLFDSCDESKYDRFIKSNDGVVQWHCTMKKDLEMLCTFISSIWSCRTNLKKRDLVFYQYIDAVFGKDFVKNRGKSTYNELINHLWQCIDVEPMQSTLSFYSKEHSDKEISDGAVFIQSLEKKICSKKLFNLLLTLHRYQI